MCHGSVCPLERLVEVQIRSLEETIVIFLFIWDESGDSLHRHA